MSGTAILWLSLFTVLAFASFRRPVYAAVAACLVFFANPSQWWFGDGLLTSITTRWSLVACTILLLANLITRHERPAMTPIAKRYCLLLVFMTLNAFFVNSFLAADPVMSARTFDILWKGCVACVLILLTLWTIEDVHRFLLAIVACAGFVGYEVIFAGVGGTSAGRLEGLEFPGAEGSNGTAAVMCMGLVLASFFIVRMRGPFQWLISLACAPLILETVLRCNSRGAYLSLIASGAVILLLSRGQNKKKALILAGLASLSVLVLAKNTYLWERFHSIFVEESSRDSSASVRLLYWEAALNMIADYPLGSGGEAAFKSDRGMLYITHIRTDQYRSVHNSILDIAASWGIQGLSLFLTVIIYPIYKAIKNARSQPSSYDHSTLLLLVYLAAAIFGQIVASCFTSVLDGEWILWLTSVCIAIDAQTNKSRVEQLTDTNALSNGTPP